MHHIGFFIYPGHQMLDLAGPLCAFEFTRHTLGYQHYALSTLSVSGGTIVSSSGVGIDSARADGALLNTLIIVGGEIDQMLDHVQIEAVTALTQQASRIASICTGAFLLAAAGLLDGHRATTHWAFARQLQHQHPNIKIEADQIFVEDNAIWTSAGVTAGIDLALALIEKDHGSDIAHKTAQELVVYHRRPGGQSQFSPLSIMTPESDRIRIALTFIRNHLHEPLPVSRLAEAVHLSARQFSRLFLHETGDTPAKAVERLRAEAARLRLQDGSEPVEQIAQAVGFSDPERMRRAFTRIYGMPPQAIRRQRNATLATA